MDSAVKCELSRDRERGPGYGILTISPFLAPAEGLEFALMRNQGTERYLGPDGKWRTGKSLLTATASPGDSGGIVAQVGPQLVDAIVAQPHHVAYRLMISTNKGRAYGTLKINPPLFGSEAATVKPADSTEPALVESMQIPAAGDSETPSVDRKTEESAAEPPESLEPPPVAEPKPVEIPPERPSHRPAWILPLMLLGLLLFTALGAYYVWQACLISSFQMVACSAPDVTDEMPAVETAPQGRAAEPAERATPAPAGDRQITSCKGLEPTDCISAAGAAAKAGDLELTRQLLQQGARMGSVEAMLRVGEMYDPDTWSADSSPESEPDWETAAFWYESAAQLGDLEGLLRAGKVLCGHATNTLEVRRGKDFLEQALAEGAATDTATLLSTCGSRVP